MPFATTAETNYEGNALPILEPGIYDNASLLGGKFETGLKKDNGDLLADRITVMFRTEDGSPFNHSELRPDTPEKEDNMVKRIGHILSKFYDRAQLVQSNATFETYAAWAIQMLNAAVPRNQKVKLMITGSVYNNKARSGFPGYPPFIKKAGEELNFDQNAKKGNAEYFAFKNPAPDAPAANPATGAPTAAKVGEF